MNELQVFESKEFGSLETMLIDGKPYFVANDVAKALGYSSAKNAVTRHCKGALKRCYLTNSGMQETKFIPEGDVWRLIIRSNLPQAEKYESWVFDEVLPTIRNHGMYATDELIANPDLAIAAFQALKAEREQRERLQLECNKQKQLIGELQPKANYVDVILDNKGLCTVTQIAKDYGMSGSRMNKLLNEYGVQYKQSGQWLLYRKYHSMGYTHSKTVDITRTDGRRDIVLETKWTQKGRLFIYELLKSNGIIPIIEQDLIA